MVKYVDDTTTIENVHPDRSTKHFTTSQTIETVHPAATDELLGRIITKAGDIGMVVNCKKTQLLVASPDNCCHTVASITAEEERIGSTETMKMLGFMFNSACNMNAQMDLIRRKFRGRFWSLIHLRNAGLKNN